MNDKQLLQMIERLGKNSRKSLAASEVVTNDDQDDQMRSYSEENYYWS